MPPLLWHRLIAIVPYYQYAIVGKFPVQLIPAYRNAPPARWVQGWRKGGCHHVKEDFTRTIFW